MGDMEDNTLAKLFSNGTHGPHVLQGMDKMFRDFLDDHITHSLLTSVIILGIE